MSVFIGVSTNNLLLVFFTLMDIGMKPLLLIILEEQHFWDSVLMLIHIIWKILKIKYMLPFYMLPFDTS